MVVILSFGCYLAVVNFRGDPETHVLECFGY